MLVRLVAILALFVPFVAGCSSAPPAKPQPVAVSGTVTLPNGQPATDVTINFLPTPADQSQGFAKLANGKFSAKLNPGKYTYGFEGTAAGLKDIPKKYHSNNAEHSVEIQAGAELGINLTN